MRLDFYAPDSNFSKKLLEQFFFLIFASYFYNIHFLSFKFVFIFALKINLSIAYYSSKESQNQKRLEFL